MAAQDNTPAEPEVWWIRTETGEVISMQLPLWEGIPQRLRTGALVRVNEDGTPWVPPADAVEAPPASMAEKLADEAKAEAVKVEVPKPAPGDLKARWVEYAASTGQITADAANDLTKAELIARFG